MFLTPTQLAAKLSFFLLKGYEIRSTGDTICARDANEIVWIVWPSSRCRGHWAECTYE